MLKPVVNEKASVRGQEFSPIFRKLGYQQEVIGHDLLDLKAPVFSVEQGYV